MCTKFYSAFRFFLLLFSASSFVAAAQQSQLSCSSTNVPFVNNNTPAFTVTASSGATGSGSWLNTANVTDNNLSNFATGSFLLVPGTLTLAVADAANSYNAGNFAGFVIESSALSLNALGSLTIKTYLNGSLQETKTNSALLAIGSTLISGAYEVGFYTNEAFNEVEITATSTVGLAGYNVYYAILKGTGSCNSPALSCNANTAPAFPQFATVVDPEFTGTNGALSLTAITNSNNVVDGDDATYATITTVAGVAGSAFLAVKDVTTDYTAGTFAGFDIQNPALASVDLLSNVTIRTYKDGLLQETQTGSNLLVGASVLAAGSRQKVGFVTTLSFDEVQLVITQPLAGIALGSTRVYSALLKKLCAANALVCNTPASLDETQYPAFIDLSKTGIAGVACVACRVDSTGNLLDGNTGTAATINLTAGALASGSIAITDAVGTYEAGTFAGFDIQNLALLDVAVLNNITVRTYLGGTLQDSFTGSTLLAGVSSNLLSTAGRLTVGGIATQTFNEIQLTVAQTVGVDLGITKVYSGSLIKYCAGAPACNRASFLNTDAFPVFIDGRNTGVTGAVCVACNVANAANAISADTTDYALLTTVAGVAASTSLSVHDAVTTYPAGTIAGFAIAETAGLLQANLFKTLTVSTYNNGVFQESRSAGQLLNLSALVVQVNPVAGAYRVGLVATLPFNEVRISVTPLVGVLPVVRVYGAFADTRFGSGSALQATCNRPPLAEPDHIATILNTAVTGSLKTNDRDPQGSLLTYSTTAVIPPANGTVTITAEGNFIYTPTTGFSGLDSFRYGVCNAGGGCDTAFAFVSTLPPSMPGTANRAPITQPDFGQTLVNIPVTGDAGKNDADPDGNPLTYTVLQQPKNGTLVLNSTGGYTYTPDSSFVGSDTAQLQACDNATPALCATSRLLLKVSPDANGPGNDAPFAQDDIVMTPSGTNVTGNITGNDQDP